MCLRTVFLYGLLYIAVVMTRSIANGERVEDIDLKHQSVWDEATNWTGSDYLYHKGDAWPIIDYDRDGWPEWLYQPYDRPRVVEFYAPWCPFCRAFRDHYIQFARVMSEMTKELHGQQIEFYAISCGANEPICKDFRLKGFPKLLLFRAGATKATSKIKYYNLHPYEVLNKLGIEIDLDLGKNQQLIESLQIKHKEKGDISFPPRTKQEVFDDAYRSFDFMLRHSVYTGEGEVEKDRKEALQQFLELLIGFVPPAWRLAQYVRELLKHFPNAMTHEERLLKICDKYKPEEGTWSYACTKGVDGMGYSCGLWQLLHIFSVGMLEYNGLLGEDQGDKIIGTVPAADSIRNFIEGFMDCEVCRDNFLKAYDTCAFNRCERLNEDKDMEQLVQLPLWLWETHNAVNQRLLREHGEQQGWNVTALDQRLRRWPSSEECPKCWTSEGSWDEENLYKFLRVEYWVEDGVTEEFRKDLFDGVDLDEIMRKEEEILGVAVEEKQKQNAVTEIVVQDKVQTTKGNQKQKNEGGIEANDEEHPVSGQAIKEGNTDTPDVSAVSEESMRREDVAGGKQYDLEGVEVADKLIQHAASQQIANSEDAMNNEEMEL